MNPSITITINNLTPEKARDILAELEGFVPEQETDTPIATAGEDIEPGDLVFKATAPALDTVLDAPMYQDVTQPTDLVDQETGEVTTAAVELDKTGLPWDERIHSSSKKMSVKGVWAKRRNVQPFEFDAVADELRAAQAPTAPTIPTAAEIIAAPVDFTALSHIPEVAPAPAPVAAPAPPVAEPVAPARDFQGLMTRLQTLHETKVIDANYFQWIVDSVNSGFTVNLVTITDVAHNAEHVKYAWECLDVDGKAA